jgi:hypothetical protein
MVGVADAVVVAIGVASFVWMPLTEPTYNRTPSYRARLAGEESKSEDTDQRSTLFAGTLAAWGKQAGLSQGLDSLDLAETGYSRSLAPT